LCDVGEGESVDFAGILKALEEIGYSRWVTSCPGVPIPGQDDTLGEARSSRKMREYLKRLGY
jgi:sugar phosphate isomerase/epimerase